jgi:hypothetical protein
VDTPFEEKECWGVRSPSDNIEGGSRLQEEKARTKCRGDPGAAAAGTRGAARFAAQASHRQERKDIARHGHRTKDSSATQWLPRRRPGDARFPESVPFQLGPPPGRY